jgi:hypothetical protein
MMNSANQFFMNISSNIAEFGSWIQFWWGFFGGFIVVAYRLYAYVTRLADNAPWPHLKFKTCLLLGWWLVFPVCSGFLSIVCEPHAPLIAVFEGRLRLHCFYYMQRISN